MNIRKWTWRTGIAAMLVILFASSARADLYWETQSVSTDIPSRLNGTSIQKYYLTARASRMETGEKKVFIVDYNTMELISLDTKRKTFTRLNLSDLPTLPGSRSSGTKKVNKAFQKLIGLHITPTDELKTIAGYRCRKYNVHIAMVDGEYWVSKDVRGYQELKKLGANMETVVGRSPMLQQLDFAGLVERLGGFPVYIINHVMGGTITSRLTKVEEKSLDPALFVVPKEYKAEKSRRCAAGHA